VATATLLAVAAVAGPYALGAALLVAVVAVASGWPLLLGLPTPRGTTAVVALGGAVAVAVVGLTRDEPYLRWLPVVLGLAIVAEFGHQLLRRDMRPRLVESVTGVVTGVVLVVLGAGWMGALHAARGPELVLVGAAACVVASAATALPWPQRNTAPSAVVAAVAFGALACRLLPDSQAVPAAVVGLGVGAVVAVSDRLFAHLPTSRHLPAAVAMGAAPVAASGIVVFLLGRLLG
jgi:hypothetical protein